LELGDEVTAGDALEYEDEGYNEDDVSDDATRPGAGIIEI